MENEANKNSANEKGGTFHYSYSAKEQEELKKIRSKYVPGREENSMERLRRLDRSVTKKGSVVAVIMGIIGCLIMGFGMSLIMTNLFESIGIGESLVMPIGIVLGVIGMTLVGLAYPIYNHITKKERERIAPEIIRLTDELMK